MRESLCTPLGCPRKRLKAFRGPDKLCLVKYNRWGSLENSATYLVLRAAVAAIQIAHACLQRDPAAVQVIEFSRILAGYRKFAPIILFGEGHIACASKVWVQGSKGCLQASNGIYYLHTTP